MTGLGGRIWKVCPDQVSSWNQDLLVSKKCLQTQHWNSSMLSFTSPGWRIENTCIELYMHSYYVSDSKSELQCFIVEYWIRKTFLTLTHFASAPYPSLTMPCPSTWWFTCLLSPSCWDWRIPMEDFGIPNVTTCGYFLFETAHGN